MNFDNVQVGPVRVSIEQLERLGKRVEVVGVFEEPGDVAGPSVIDAIVIERHLVPHHSELPSCVAVVLAFDSEGAPIAAHLDDDLRSNHRITSVWMWFGRQTLNIAKSLGLHLFAFQAKVRKSDLDSRTVKGLVLELSRM